MADSHTHVVRLGTGHSGVDSEHKGAMAPFGHNHEIGLGWLWPRRSHYHIFAALFLGNEEELMDGAVRITSSIATPVSA